MKFVTITVEAGDSVQAQIQLQTKIPHVHSEWIVNILLQHLDREGFRFALKRSPIAERHSYRPIGS